VRNDGDRRDEKGAEEDGDSYSRAFDRLHSDSRFDSGILVIPSILPKIMSIPAELTAELVPVAVGGAASLVTLTVADLKKLLRR
jgi:hypothetical protein